MNQKLPYNIFCDKRIKKKSRLKMKLFSRSIIFLFQFYIRNIFCILFMLCSSTGLVLELVAAQLFQIILENNFPECITNVFMFRKFYHSA